MNRRTTFVALGAAALVLGLQAPASADQADDEVVVAQAADEDVAQGEAKQPGRAARIGIEEITVTARKRAERLQDTPIAITAFNSDAIKDLDVRAIQDINSLVPNLQFDKAVGQASAARIYLRGVGNGDPISSDDPGVGVYVDGVYLPRAQGALLTVSDIAQVDVLRGPQGTLFGKNTIGGAVSITTQKPSFDFGGAAELRLGYLGQVESRAHVNIPLVPEMAAMRISFASATNRGYVHNRFTGDRVSDEKLLAGRVQFLLTPTPSSEFVLTMDHSREPRSATAAKCKVIASDAPATRGLLRGGLFRFIAPEVQTGCEADDARADDEVVQDGKSKDGIRTYGTTLIGTFDLDNDMTFKSTTSWRRNKTMRYFDADGTPLNIAQDQRDLGGDKAKQNSYSQEFNLTGLGMGGRLKWTTGAYYFYEKNQSTDTAQALRIADQLGAFTSADLGSPELNRDSLLRNVLVPVADNLIAAGVDLSDSRLILQSTSNVRTFNGVGPCLTGDLGGLSPALAGLCASAFRSVPTRGFFRTSTTSYAGYGEVTYDITDDLNFTAGLRYTHERKRVAQVDVALRGPNGVGAGSINEPAATVPVTPGGPLFTNFYELSDRFGKFTPRATLQYRFNDDMNAYATISRGFKSGTFSRPDSGQVPNSVKPEVLTSYEIGMKSQFFDNRLTANLATFLNYYNDIQLTKVAANADGTLRVETQNAGQARIYGTELELTAVPIPGLILSSQIGLLRARYTQFDPTPGDDPKLPGTPGLTMTYTAAYTTPVGELGDLRTTLTWFHQGKKGTDILDPHFTRVNKHGLLSARVALEMSDGVTELALVGKNLLNREYFANAIDITGSVGTTLRYYGAPRALSLEIRRQF